METKHTPITDALEASIESAGKRDVPVRVYQQMRALESTNADLLAALEILVERHYGGECAEVSMARAAIARAKGQ